MTGGWGTQAVPLAKQGWHVTACDVSESNMDDARNYAGEEGVSVDFRVSSLVKSYRPLTQGTKTCYPCTRGHLLDKEGSNGQTRARYTATNTTTGASFKDRSSGSCKASSVVGWTFVWSFSCPLVCICSQRCCSGDFGSPAIELEVPDLQWISVQNVFQHKSAVIRALHNRWYAQPHVALVQIAQCRKVIVSG
jgi:hypothetical protein